MTERHVLVVQDDPPNAYLLRRLLGRWGYVVEEAPDAQRAWQRLIEPPPVQVVLVDHGLADGGALELCRRIQRGHPAGAPAPQIVVIGGPGDEVSRARALKAGARAVVRKPFLLGELRVCLDGPGPPDQARRR